MSASPDEQGEPLAACGLLDGGVNFLFIRSIARQAIWQTALDSGKRDEAEQLFASPDGKVSLWKVASYWDLRTVAFAINESRPHRFERLNLLPIYEDELLTCNVVVLQSRGETSCPHAAALHHDAEMDSAQVSRLSELLINAQRLMTRISRGSMKSALSVSEDEGCFSVVDARDLCSACDASSER